MEAALELDAGDPVAPWRAKFILPDGVIYLDGNSLGALPAETPTLQLETMREQWGRDLIASWNTHDWVGAPRRIGDLIAPLVGARPGEVVVTDSTSVNLYKLLHAALAHDPRRRVIVADPGEFPTDLYIAQGLAAQGLAELRPAPDGDLHTAIDEDVAVVLASHVHYRSGRKRDLATLTAAAHAKGALMLWDLSHSTGATSVQLGAARADLAVGCGYKYLNGGPGAPAFLYVAERLQARLLSPLAGWFGHAEPFAFAPDYRPAPGVERFLCGTPPMLAMSALETGVAMFADIDSAALYAKGQRLCDLFIAELDAFAPEYGLELVTPRDVTLRGSHVSYVHPQAHAVVQALIAAKVVGDFRAPDVARFGFAPLYVSYTDVWRAAAQLRTLLETGAWRDPRFDVRAKVT